MKAPTTPEAALARDEKLARKWEPKVRSLFRREGRRVVRANGRSGYRVRDWERLLAELWADTAQQVVPATYEALTGTPWEERQNVTLGELYALIARLIEDGGGANTIRAYNQEAAQGIITTTRRRIRTVLRGVKRGEAQTIREALQRLYKTDFIKRRGSRVALDQVLRSTATFEHQAALAAEKRGFTYRKIWRNQGDSRVRDSHTGVEPVEGEETPFQLTGGTVRFPRDPAGPASETYGCRCWTERERIEKPKAAPQPARPAAGKTWPIDDDATREFFDGGGVFATIDDAKAFGDDYAASLTSDQVGALNRYTKSSYERINAALQESSLYGVDVDSLLDASDLADMRLIDDALAAAKPFNDDVVVWRGIRSPSLPLHVLTDEDAVLRETGRWARERFKPGDVYEFGGFQSSSFDPVPALNGATGPKSPGVIFEIRTSRGGYLNELSQFDDEFELLLGRNSEFRVVDVLDDVEFEQWESDTVLRRTVVQLEAL